MILLTNDDGIYSAGLRAAHETLNEIDEVVIVAPITQMSAVGRSISIMQPVRIYEMKINDNRAYAIDGTPTDAVILGIYEIIGRIPELTVCGINLGENLSTEAVTTSGTVCSALEAATQGSKAIAISMEMHEKDKFEPTCEHDFEDAKRVLRWIVKKILKTGLPDCVDVVNVNVPKKFNGKIKITRLARKMYETRVEKRIDPRGREYYWIHGIEVENAEEGTDIHALRNGFVSITPISLNTISFKNLEVWRDEWENQRF
ncbi:MAG: 5'/3'-nucleotidase SurE [Archaeoglobaceae archaeon]|nr:5'/3'-nucleotidase SurE [Archaeoglobaceae archaeon]MDW7989275.1 5'/3'-nucleotidase SurE [Archaeoglobaceae archaeon]